jgi:hypothetical protein
VSIQTNDVDSIESQLNAKNAQLHSAQNAQAVATERYEEELTGANGNPPGNGPLTQLLFEQYQQSVNYTKSVSQALSNLQTQDEKSRAALTQAQQQANHALQGVSPGEGNRAAEASWWVFILGLLTGLNCVLTGSARSRELTEDADSGLDAEEIAEDAPKPIPRPEVAGVVSKDAAAGGSESADTKLLRIPESPNGRSARTETGP